MCSRSSTVKLCSIFKWGWYRSCYYIDQHHHNHICTCYSAFDTPLHWLCCSCGCHCNGLFYPSGEFFHPFLMTMKGVSWWFKLLHQSSQLSTSQCLFVMWKTLYFCFILTVLIFQMPSVAGGHFSNHVRVGIKHLCQGLCQQSAAIYAFSGYGVHFLVYWKSPCFKQEPDCFNWRL